MTPTTDGAGTISPFRNLTKYNEIDSNLTQSLLPNYDETK